MNIDAISDLLDEKLEPVLVKLDFISQLVLRQGQSLSDLRTRVEYIEDHPKSATM